MPASQKGLARRSNPETVPPGTSLATYGHNMLPLRGSAADRRPLAQPLFHYPFAQWRPALAAMATSAEIDAHLGHALEFLNPATGGAILPTISAHVRLLPAGFESRARRATDGTVFVVVEGDGAAVIDGKEMPLRHRDIFVVPSWHELRFRADSDLVLFGYSDKAAQEKLNIYKESNR